MPLCLFNFLFHFSPKCIQCGCEGRQLTLKEELAEDAMYLSVSDEDDSPEKCIPYFSPCRRTRSVPEEMAAWDREKQGETKEADVVEEVEPEAPPAVPQRCPRIAARGMGFKPAPGWRSGCLPGLPGPGIYDPCWGGEHPSHHPGPRPHPDGRGCGRWIWSE